MPGRKCGLFYTISLNYLFPVWRCGHQSPLPHPRSLHMSWILVNLNLTSRIFSWHSGFQARASRASGHHTPNRTHRSIVYYPRNFVSYSSGGEEGLKNSRTLPLWCRCHSAQPAKLSGQLGTRRCVGRWWEEQYADDGEINGPSSSIACRVGFYWVFLRKKSNWIGSLWNSSLLKVWRSFFYPNCALIIINDFYPLILFDRAC